MLNFVAAHMSVFLHTQRSGSPPSPYKNSTVHFLLDMRDLFGAGSVTALDAASYSGAARASSDLELPCRDALARLRIHEDRVSAQVQESQPVFNRPHEHDELGRLRDRRADLEVKRLPPHAYQLIDARVLPKHTQAYLLRGERVSEVGRSGPRARQRIVVQSLVGLSRDQHAVQLES
jgi:hypothetical protein